MNEIFDVMNEIVERDVVAAYKKDLEIDKGIMLDEDSEKQFYWLVRKCGTNIYEKNKIKFKDSEENISANCQVNDKVISIFYINIEKRDINNVYGSIKKISIADFKKIISENIKIIKEKEIKVEFKDGTIVQNVFVGDGREIMYNIINANKKQVEDLKYFKVIKYIA